LAWHRMISTNWNPCRFQANLSINFGLWIMCFSRSGTSSPSCSQIIGWSDLSTSRWVVKGYHISPSYPWCRMDNKRSRS
jgi:hypothetical protein